MGVSFENSSESRNLSDFKSVGKLFKSQQVKIKPEEARRNRAAVLILLGLTLVAIFAVVLYRDQKAIFGKFFDLETMVLIPNSSPKPEATPTPKFIKEAEEIKSLVKDLKGKYGVFVQDLASGESYGINMGEVFTAASLIKLPVLLTLYQEAEAGNLRLDTKYAIKPGDKRGGAGSLQSKSPGTLVTYRKMAELMGQQSDNTAFHILSELLSEAKIQRTIDSLGMEATSFSKNETTPEDVGKFFYKLYLGNVLVREDRDELLSFLTKTIWEDRIPAGVPKDVRVAHKIGTEIGVVSDAGIVFGPKKFILVILSEEVLESKAKEILPKISQLVYQQMVGGETGLVN